MSQIINSLASGDTTAKQIMIDRIFELCENAERCNQTSSTITSTKPGVILIHKGATPFETHFLETEAAYRSLPEFVFVPWLALPNSLIGVSRPLAGGTEVISGPFSGCYMGLFTASNGTRRIAHIQTSKEKNADNHSAWNATHYTGVQLVRPQTADFGFCSFAIYDHPADKWYNVLISNRDDQPHTLHGIFELTPQSATDIVKNPVSGDAAHRTGVQPYTPA